MIHNMPVMFEDSVELFSNALSKNKRIQLLGYAGGLTTPLEVLSFTFEETENPSDSTVVMNISYRYPVFGSAVVSTDKSRRLRFLASTGDVEWTERMRLKIWDGNYPTTVAVDEDSREVFLVRVYDNYLSLEVFGSFLDEQFNAYMEDLDDREPFKIYIDAKAMFQYIDGAEGLNYLHQGVYIEFNCSVPIRIYRQLMD